MEKFKIGDRVRFTGASLVHVKKGDTGTYKGAYAGLFEVCALVEWDNEVSGIMHNGADRNHGPRCAAGHGWAVPENSLELIPVEKKKQNKVVIYQQDEKTVVAKDLATGKTAKAVCSKDDVFNFGIGAKLAVSRLYPDPVTVKPAEPLNCRFVVTSTRDPDLTVGKVYEMQHGIFVDDKGAHYGTRSPFTDWEKFKLYCSGSKNSGYYFGARKQDYSFDAVRLVETEAKK